MNKSRVTWVFIAAVVVLGIIAINYQNTKDALPLSEIFPDEEVMPVSADYEFVQEQSSPLSQEPVARIASKQTAEPAPLERTSQLADLDEDGTKVKSKYTIQIASFKDKSKAQAALSSIRLQVPSAYIATRDLGQRGVWYRIYAGQFELHSEAEVSLSDIQQNFNNSFIISPK